MSMTYYAVTNDPNELVHWGVKGMRWGVRHDKPRHSGSSRPRSAAYKKAQSKLGKMMKSGIKKAEASWQSYNSPEAKNYRAYKKYQKQTDRAIELARKGKLKYGKLTDDQVQRVTERLAMERDARMLSETEKTWGKRLRESIGEGIISGVGSGVGRITSEAISRKSTLKTDRKRKELQNQMDIEQRRRMNAIDLDQQRREQLQKYDLERRHEIEKMRNEAKDARQKAQNQVKEEYELEAARRGMTTGHKVKSFISTGRRDALYLTKHERAKQLQAWKDNDIAESDAKERNKLYERTYYVERAKNQAKLDSGVSDKDSKSKKDKKKKDKGPGESQAPIVNIYTSQYPSVRTTDRKWREEERRRRQNGRKINHY